MAATFEPIATTTLGSTATSFTFSSIPSTYTDLKLVVTSISNTGSGQIGMRFNNDTGANYSRTYLYGNGTSALSGAQTGVDKIESLNYSGTLPKLTSYDIFSYAGSTYKTCLLVDSNDRNGSGFTNSTVGLWRNTSAINRIDILGTTFDVGTTATLYGIKSF